MFMSVKERLLKFLEYKQMTQLEFTRRIGVAPSYIGAMRRSISDDKVKTIRHEFPELNTSWLLYGEGKMINAAGRNKEVAGEGYAAEPDTTALSRDVRMYEVPLLPVAAYAGNLQMWSEGVALRDCEKVVSPVKGADFAIKVSGDSMEPDLHDGATILIKKINDVAFIPWGNKMVIDTENGVLVKEVYPVRETHRRIEARSLNPKYPPFEIPTESIYGLYRILGQVQIFTTM